MLKLVKNVNNLNLFVQTWKVAKRFSKLEIGLLLSTVWSKPDEFGKSLLDKILKKLIENERFSLDRNSQTSFVIVDSKSIKNTDKAKEKGYTPIKNFWQSLRDRKKIADFGRTANVNFQLQSS